MEPAGHLEPQEWMTAPATRAVLDALTAEGQTVRFVGGCVRDAVVGRRVQDVDIATPDRPEQTMRLLEGAGLRAVPTGIDHGTVTAVADHVPFEVTTLRRDVEPLGRRARVEFTDDWVADAARRDLTMNALFLDPDGTIYDPFGGLADLKQGVVRFVGNAAARIREDYLRLLRFYRFHAHYGRVEPDPAVLTVTGELAPHLAELSGERLQSEILRLLGASDPTHAVGLMARHGVLRSLLPGATALPVLANLVELERSFDTSYPLRRLAALMGGPAGGDGLGPTAETLEEVAERLRFSREQARRWFSMLLPANPIRPGDEAHRLHQVVQHIGVAMAKDLLLLTAAQQGGDDTAALTAALAEIRGWTPREFPLKGRDVLDLGVPSGPEVGRILDDVHDWWARHDFRPDRDACLAELRRRLEA